MLVRQGGIKPQHRRGGGGGRHSPELLTQDPAAQRVEHPEGVSLPRHVLVEGRLRTLKPRKGPLKRGQPQSEGALIARSRRATFERRAPHVVPRQTYLQHVEHGALQVVPRQRREAPQDRVPPHRRCSQTLHGLRLVSAASGDHRHRRNAEHDAIAPRRTSPLHTFHR